MCANNAEPSNTGNSTKQPMASLSRSRVEVRGRLEQNSHPLTGICPLLLLSGRSGNLQKNKEYIGLPISIQSAEIHQIFFTMTKNAVSVHSILGQIFFYKLIYWRAYPEILAPPEKNAILNVFNPRPSIHLKKIYLFYLYP